MAEGDRTLTATAQASLVGSYDLTADLGDVIGSYSIVKEYAITHGTGAGQADRMWKNSRGPVPSSETFNLFDDAGANLWDVFSNGAFQIVELVLLYVVNTHASAAISMGAAGATPVQGLFANTNDILTIPPGGAFLYVNRNDPALAISGLGKNLKFAGSGITYDITILGRSA